jgi:hypothetical protein
MENRNKLLQVKGKVRSIRFADAVKIKCKLLILICLIVVQTTSVNAQLTSEAFKKLSVSYFGVSGTYPGIKLSSSFLEKSIGMKSKIQLLPGIGAYFHYQNNTGAFLSLDLRYKAINNNGLFGDFTFGAGYLRTFLAGKVYEVDSNGEVERIYLAGNNQFMTSLAFGIGKELKKNNAPISEYFFRVGGFLQYPFNTNWLPNLTFEAGVSFNLTKK